MMTMVNEKHLYKVLELPKHLQTSLITVLKMGVASATDISRITGKVRAVESNYLNQLVYMKILLKERHDRKILFHVNLEALDW